MKKDFFLPIIVLSLICFFVSGSLAVLDTFTSPKIEQDAAQRTRAEMEKIMPQAVDFKEINNIDDHPQIPGTITGIYNAISNDGSTLGFLFLISVPGYGGDVNLICTITPDGKILRAAVLSHRETPSFAARVFIESHVGQYWGRDRNGIEGIAPVSGATISSNAFKNAMRHALAAFEVTSALKQEGKL